MKRCKAPPVILYNFNQNGISIVQTEFLANLDVFCILLLFEIISFFICVEYLFVVQINAYFYGDANQLRKSYNSTS